MREAASSLCECKSQGKSLIYTALTSQTHTPMYTLSVDSSLSHLLKQEISTGKDSIVGPLHAEKPSKIIASSNHGQRMQAHAVDQGIFTVDIMILSYNFRD